jgi:hypothetical protein
MKKGVGDAKAGGRLTRLIDDLSNENVMSLSRLSTPELEKALFGSQASADLLQSLIEKGTSVAGITKVLGSANPDLTYNPLVPCRIMDTRFGQGALTANTNRSFDIEAADIAAQGGVPSGGCGIPLNARAISVNITVIGAGDGYLFIWPDTFLQPNASIINWHPATGGPIANAAVVSIFPANPSAWIRAEPAGTTGTHVIMDVLGYFAPPVATALSCVELYNATNTLVNPSGATACVDAPACTAGYTPVSVLTRWISGGAASLVQVQANPSATYFSACYVNHTATVSTQNVGVRCCRVPGS